MWLGVGVWMCGRRCSDEAELKRPESLARRARAAAPTIWERRLGSAWNLVRPDTAHSSRLVRTKIRLEQAEDEIGQGLDELRARAREGTR